MSRILVVDDEQQILRAVQRALVARGYEVVSAVDGGDALVEAEASAPDLIVLDLNLPDMDGLEACRRLRAWTRVPILILSVREDEAGKVHALDLGADDYLTKPFGVEELLARVRALLRRTHPEGSEPPRFVVDGVTIDLVARRVAREGADVHLTKTEWALLQALAEHPGKLLTHRWLLERVWGHGYQEDVEVLRVFVSQLRKKVEPNPSRPSLILTDPGVGYRWAAAPEGS
ncbi:MAG TPA: response regulator transcription factor [Actinomycetota bacterium]|nr:response regulator transcription factor [Actinomycetota bacterium]